ncbi:MAG: hypothetical protein LLG20_07905 [Acidobacteriales bacterium]|nr:hypothetical protein [Terriglobales bacterium]
MKHALYQVLVPRFVKDRLFRMHLREIRDGDLRRRTALDVHVPKVSLSPSYVRNLRIVIDRIALLAEMPREAVVAIVGMKDAEMIRRLMHISRPREVRLVGLWSGDITRDALSHMFGDEIENGSLVIHEEDTRGAAVRFPDGYFDWVYLNERFSYGETSALLEMWRTKVNNKGFIAGSHYGTGSWVTNERYGVVEAVNHFCKAHQWEMALLTHEQDRLLDYAIRGMNHSL